MVFLVAAKLDGISTNEVQRYNYTNPAENPTDPTEDPMDGEFIHRLHLEKVNEFENQVISEKCHVLLITLALLCILTSSSLSSSTSLFPESSPKLTDFFRWPEERLFLLLFLSSSSQSFASVSFATFIL